MSTLTVGTISEKVTDAGVAVDGVTLKDGGATLTSNLIIPNGGNIGSASDTDSMAISSGGVVTFSQSPIGTGMDRLLSNTTSSPASSVDISNTYINSTYDTYLVIFRITPSTDNVQLRLRFATDGSTFQTGNIYGAEVYLMHENNGAVGGNAVSAWRLSQDNIGNSTGEAVNGFFYLVGANNTTYPSTIHGNSSHINTSANHNAQVFAGSQIVSARDGVVNGLQFLMSSGNIENSEITIYGLDKN